jgi:hypothetical protein
MTELVEVIMKLGSAYSFWDHAFTAGDGRRQEAMA